MTDMFQPVGYHELDWRVRLRRHHLALTYLGWGHPLGILSGDDWHVAINMYLIHDPSWEPKCIASLKLTRISYEIESLIFPADSLNSETYRLYDVLHAWRLGEVT